MTNELRQIEDHWQETVVPSILEQYKNSAKWQSLLKSVIDQMQICEDAAIELSQMLDLSGDAPTGYKLDWLAGLVNVKRMAGESDADFFDRFMSILGNSKAGTPDEVIRTTRLLSGDTRPRYMDEAPATFMIYTGPRPKEPGSDELEQGGRQLMRQQVKKMAPAGVLGLPGAALRLADGSLLGTTDKKLILAVAPDTTEPFTITFGFITNDGDRIVTNGGDRIVGTSTA